MKKLVLFALTAAMAATACVGCNRGVGDTVEVDTKRTQLYVYNYDGGVGSEWLDKAIVRFEAAYANEKFEEGKLGVQVVPQKTKSGFESLLTTSKNAVFFVQQAYYNQLMATGKLLPINDVVTEKTGSRSIEDLLTPEQKAAFTAYDGNYYVLPHYELYSGVTYDKDVFESKSLYFKEGGGWTGDVSKAAAGPDGDVATTYDNGLPSSIEEFKTLCKRMVLMNVIPFVFSGQYTAYSTHLLNGLWVSLTGAEDFYTNFSLNSGDKEISYISGFDGDTPILSKTKITPENGYYLNAQEGKYYALDFMRAAINGDGTAEDPQNPWFDDGCYNGAFSHTDTHRRFIRSLPESEESADKKPVAMLIEGTHWYNEAGEVLKDTAKNYPDYAERRFAAMPLPTRKDDSTPCKKNTVCDSNSSFAFINANIKGDAVAVDLAKKFLKFCYTEESLQEFTVTTGVSKGVKYEMTTAQYEAMPTYFKSLWDIKSNSNIVYPYSNTTIFVKHQPDFNFAQDTAMWTSGKYSLPWGALKDYKQSAKAYFNQGWTDATAMQNQWNKNYSDSME